MFSQWQMLKKSDDFSSPAGPNFEEEVLDRPWICSKRIIFFLLVIKKKKMCSMFTFEKKKICPILQAIVIVEWVN